MTQDTKDNQPKAPLGEGSSMEEILSSIRQAMSEGLQDTSAASFEDETPSVEPFQKPMNDPDVLELNTTSTPPQKRPVWSNPQPLQKPIAAPEPEELCTDDALSILSPNSEKLTREALDTLDEQIQKNHAREMEQSYLALERMLRPILTQWCNKHLPEIVTRSVQKEIKFLVRQLSQKNHG